MAIKTREDIDVLKEYADFVIRPKTSSDINKIVEVVALKVANFSHNNFPSEANRFYRGLIGHTIRKNYRKVLIENIRKYVTTKLRDIKDE